MTVDEAINILVDRFEEHKRKDKPGYRVHSSQLPDFQKVAEYCLSKGIDLQIFVDSQFETVPPREMSAKRLLTKVSETNLRNYMSKHSTTHEDDFNIGVRILNNMVCVNGITDVERIYLDDTLDLQPWFRILDPLEEIPSVTAKYLPAVRKNWSQSLQTYLHNHPDYKNRLGRIW